MVIYHLMHVLHVLPILPGVQKNKLAYVSFLFGCISISKYKHTQTRYTCVHAWTQVLCNFLQLLIICFSSSSSFFSFFFLSLSSSTFLCFLLQPHVLLPWKDGNGTIDKPRTYTRWSLFPYQEYLSSSPSYPICVTLVKGNFHITCLPALGYFVLLCFTSYLVSLSQLSLPLSSFLFLFSLDNLSQQVNFLVFDNGLIY